MRKTNNERRVCVYGGGTLNVVARLKRLASWEGSGPGVCFQQGDAGLRFFLCIPQRKYSEHKLQALSYFSPKKGFNYM